ncbi:MAG: 2OG-Fe(II) oxygenase [Holosporales bacterium]|jgi:hypothetical protein
MSLQSSLPIKENHLIYQNFIRSIDWQQYGTIFKRGEPFNHVVIDDFFLPEIAERLAEEFPAFDASCWSYYSNPIEEKKTCNAYDRFPEITYQTVDALNSIDFIENIIHLTGIQGLRADYGLNGGGWHIHSSGGKLNSHLDYSIHPKLNLERRLNLIVYLSKDWHSEWGGGLGLWSHDEKNFAPNKLIKTIDVKFNRAVLFDTTQNSWHGLPDPITCPQAVYRKSLALYYLAIPREDVSPRGKALFAPHEEQKDDTAVIELIRRRAEVKTASSVYRT